MNTVNRGVAPEERALNFSATNAFQVTQVMGSAADNQLGLNQISVIKIPYIGLIPIAMMLPYSFLT